ncbi:MAG: hypothetical protein ACRDUX_06660 [Mycobacterium sp.]
MTARTSKKVSWRRTVTGAAATGALAAGLLMGAGTAHADVLDDIYAEYDTGSGGGQVSNLIHTAMKLRAAGFVPSKGDMADLEAAMGKRPNQVPLIDALQSTVSYQKRSQQRSAPQAPAVNPGTGITPWNPGQVPDPNGAPSINSPLA